jgi:hypothetical protein
MAYLLAAPAIATPKQAKEPSMDENFIFDYIT